MKISAIKPNPNNPRIIKDDKFKKLVQSLKEFPEMAAVRPVVINEDNIILGGNMRFKAMVEAGWDDIPVTQVKGWTEEQQRQFIIKDNVSGGEWDWDLLANEWDAEELDAWGLDTPDDWGEDKEVEEDEAPEVSDEPAVSELGEIYQLGRHRVMCGDSTDFDQVTTLMAGIVADIAVTDPPYGINIVQNKSVGGGKLAKVTEYRPIENDDGVEVAHLAIDIMKETTKDQIIFGGNYFADRLEPKMCWVVWDKDNTGNFADCELAWTSFDKAAKLYKVTWNGMIREGESGKRVHPTQKPIKLFDYILKDFDPSTIQDLFLGSGSTLIACEQTDRTCYGMELDPKYVDVIRKRYHKFVTGSEDGWEEGTPAV